MVVAVAVVVVIVIDVVRFNKRHTSYIIENCFLLPFYLNLYGLK